MDTRIGELKTDIAWIKVDVGDIKLRPKAVERP